MFFESRGHRFLFLNVGHKHVQLRRYRFRFRAEFV